MEEAPGVGTSQILPRGTATAPALSTVFLPQPPRPVPVLGDDIPEKTGQSPQPQPAEGHAAQRRWPQWTRMTLAAGSPPEHRQAGQLALVRTVCPCPWLSWTGHILPFWGPGGSWLALASVLGVGTHGLPSPETRLLPDAPPGLGQVGTPCGQRLLSPPEVPRGPPHPQAAGSRGHSPSRWLTWLCLTAGR